ncbi:MAG: hypothetical protein KF833_21875 [Verrucomicrobiae bacterium]|nr:hypothetical protein [Verrucomicrobiae bacterium]
MIRRSRLPFAFVLALLLGVAGFLAFHHGQGRLQLASALSELQSRGVTFEVDPTPPAPSPASDTALPDLLTAAESLGATRLQVPMVPSIAPGRIVPATRVERWGHPGSQTHSWEDIARWAQTHAGALQSLRDTLNAPRRPSVEDPLDPGPKLLTRLSASKSAALALGMASLEAARRGDFETAVSDLESMARIERDLADAPFLIAQLVHLSVAGTAASRAASVLHAGDWTEPQLARLQAALPSSDAPEGALLGLHGDATSMVRALHRLRQWNPGEPSPYAALDFGTRTHTLHLDGNTEPPREPTLFQRAVGRLVLGSVRMADRIRRIGWHDQAFARFLLDLEPVILSRQEILREGSANRLKEWTADRSTDAPAAPWRRFYSAHVLPGFVESLDKTVAKVLQAQTQRSLLETRIALERFDRRHARLPDTLAELVPDFLASVPIDRMDGQPIRYRRDTGSGFTLWSVGENGIDHGGDATWDDPNPGTRQWWLARDGVWPEPADENAMADWHRAEAERRTRARVPFQMDEETMRRYGLRAPDGTPAPESPVPTPTQ